mmetsp:Transcript_12065/g.28065  ORF Transcript_12065/g.28065 Transcript_12065/m.28065 type:complete len:239 (-) Transcript_12065:112-828(-)
MQQLGQSEAAAAAASEDGMVLTEQTLVPAVISARSRLRTEFDDVDMDGIPLALGLANGVAAGVEGQGGGTTAPGVGKRAPIKVDSSGDLSSTANGSADGAAAAAAAAAKKRTMKNLHAHEHDISVGGPAKLFVNGLRSTGRPPSPTVRRDNQSRISQPRLYAGGTTMRSTSRSSTPTMGGAAGRPPSPLARKPSPSPRGLNSSRSVVERGKSPSKRTVRPASPMAKRRGNGYAASAFH